MILLPDVQFNIFLKASPTWPRKNKFRPVPVLDVLKESWHEQICKIKKFEVGKMVKHCMFKELRVG